MMVTTTMTKSQAFKLAQKKWGKAAYVNENPHALDAAGKAVARDEAAALRAKLAAFAKPLVRAAELAVLKAAEFCADVDADNPSLPQLKATVAEWRKQVAIADERKALEEESRKFQGKCLGHRCDVGYTANLIPGFPIGHVEGSGDTWQEAAEKAGLLT